MITVVMLSPGYPDGDGLLHAGPRGRRCHRDRGRRPAAARRCPTPRGARSRTTSTSRSPTRAPCSARCTGWPGTSGSTRWSACGSPT